MKPFFKGLFVCLCVLTTASAYSQDYKLVWSDEFNGKGAPDPKKWDYEVGYIRNKELQYYTKETTNARRYKGNLEITVRKEPMNGYAYTSGSVISKGKADWTYGKIEGRFKLPSGQGLWACFWTLGANIDQIGWPSCGEIDIFEHINTEPMIHGTGHWASDSSKHVMNGKSSPEIDVTQWHTYSVIWTPTAITWYIDDVQFHEMPIAKGINSTQEFHAPHYVLINLPIGGSWPGPPNETTPLPATMYCDYIRVYKAMIE
ncbi:glycoside hydrolase family 16 protein [Spirosoma fluviale]|uniref:Beta-glucanase, GH16 family n=1 Tax=Spirosoma fluviale TaxID=1597977 RepID=A0A286GVT2_9BACT|nr:glycoside hydrolase family 16 protein [Spirosoma fluviale]SOD99286.1 Beta-glucanase, GH16 family [Spirosoma fluviale]